MSNFVLDLETAQKLATPDSASSCAMKGGCRWLLPPGRCAGGLPEIREVVHQGRVGSLCQ